MRHRNEKQRRPRSGSRLLGNNRQVRLSATATNEASATTVVVARMLAVTLSAREILEWSAAAHVVDTDVIAARNVLIDYPRRRINAGATSLLGDPDNSESAP
jgi:hypothetical protein